MNSLYSALVNGQREFLEDGTERIVPPSSLDLHAARYIKQIDEINVGNNNILMQQQELINRQLLEIQNLNETIHGLQNYIAEFEQAVRDIKLQASLSETSDKVDSEPDSSILENQGEAGQVGCTVGDTCGSDSDSEGRGTN